MATFCWRSGTPASASHPQAQEQIFERFYRADPSRQADGLHAGLGLAIVKGYVDLMGGKISVQSTEGQGTTFRIELPASEGESCLAAPEGKRSPILNSTHHWPVVGVFEYCLRPPTMNATASTRPSKQRLKINEPKYLDDPEVVLMLRVQNDDAAAFAELLQRHWSYVFGRCYRQLRDRQDAEDLAQEVFLRVYRGRKAYRPRAKFSTWLFPYYAELAPQHAPLPAAASLSAARFPGLLTVPC